MCGSVITTLPTIAIPQIIKMGLRQFQTVLKNANKLNCSMWALKNFCEDRKINFPSPGYSVAIASPAVVWDLEGLYEVRIKATMLLTFNSPVKKANSILIVAAIIEVMIHENEI